MTRALFVGTTHYGYADWSADRSQPIRCAGRPGTLRNAVCFAGSRLAFRQLRLGRKRIHAVSVGTIVVGIADVVVHERVRAGAGRAVPSRGPSPPAPASRSRAATRDTFTANAAYDVTYDPKTAQPGEVGRALDSRRDRRRAHRQPARASTSGTNTGSRRALSPSRRTSTLRDEFKSIDYLVGPGRRRRLQAVRHHGDQAGGGLPVSASSGRRTPISRCARRVR